MRFVAGTEFAGQALQRRVQQAQRRSVRCNRTRHVGSRIWKSVAQPGQQPIGAIVVGGDYQGLGHRPQPRPPRRPRLRHRRRALDRAILAIRHACPCRTASLRDERETVDIVLDVGRRLGLDGWVLYPTRDETVAAFSRYRALLSERFRVADAGLEHDAVGLGQAEHLPSRQRARHPDAAHAGTRTASTRWKRFEVDGPLAIKPAIKEHFVYATKAKAWRANTKAELRQLFDRAADARRARRGDDPGPDSGRRRTAVRLLRVLQGRPRDGEHGRPPAPAAPAGIRPREHVRRSDRAADSRNAVRAFPARRSTTTASSSSSTSSIRATGSTSCSM